MFKVNQAVILCGGLGSRLGNLTKQVPKPMIDVCGKPFLEHLIIQLRKNGINNIVLLTGYKSALIKDYFKFGKKHGVKITYSYNPPNTDTGSRIFNSKKLLNKHFLLLYSDNYTSLNIDKLCTKFKKSKKKILLSLSRKKNGNCSFNKNTSIVDYSKLRSKKKNFVEIGYMLIDKSILKLLSKDMKNFSQFLELSSKKKLISGKIIDAEYLSIGDKRRLYETKKYFSNNNILLTDRDGTLNLIPDFERYLLDPSKIELNLKLVKKLPVQAKYICISNQAGLATGDLNKKNLININNQIRNKLLKFNINIKDFFISPHHFKSKSFFRKPRPGMFIQASKKYKFMLDKTFYIGDDVRDIEAAYNANTFIFYIGKKKLNAKQNYKFRYTLLKNNLKKIFKKKMKYEF